MSMAKSDGVERPGKVDMIVIHSIGGPRCVNGAPYFDQVRQNANFWKEYIEQQDGKSIHYIIDREGALAKSLSENKVAWHVKGYNSRSIGIELVNNGDGHDPYTDSQIATLNKLINDIRARHPITRVAAHSELDKRNMEESTGCPNARRRVDPGPLFPWDKIKEGE